jgi:hypothetical protein
MVRDQDLLTRGTGVPWAGGLVLVLLLSGCPQWLLPPLRVLSCSLDTEGVLLRFSAAPTEISIHKSFAMTEDGQALEGRFVFEGEDLSFYPLNGIRENRAYTVSIGVIAEDGRGNSLEQEFRRDFFTGTEREAPRVESIVPAEGSVLTERPEEILLRFSEAVDPASLEEALRISPSFPYALQWEEDDRQLIIRPLGPLDFGTRYTVTISSALRDRSRNSMVLPFTSGFLVEGGRLTPRFELEWSGAAGGGALSPGLTNRGLSTDAELRVSFDTEVEIESLAGFVEAQPSLGISTDTKAGSRSQAAIRFGRQPAWGEHYTLIVRKGITALRGGKTTEDLIYPLVFDSPESRPPEFLRGFFMGPSPGSGSSLGPAPGKPLSGDTDFDYLDLKVEEFPSTTPPTQVAAELCLVFRVSDAAAALSLSSAMTAFSINSSNGCVYISIKTLHVQDEAAYRAGPFNDPSLEGGGGTKLCALIYGLEVENAEARGLVVFSIGSAIADSLGNTLGQDIVITWNKQ